MPNRLTFSLRFLAACLLTGSGVAHIAGLWFRELDERAVGAMLLGAVYLIIAIGLFGQSRFSLFLGALVPAASIAVIWWTLQPVEPVYRLRMSVDAAVALFSLVALWRVRNRGSV